MKDEYKLESYENGVYSFKKIDNEEIKLKAMTNEEAIQRITNLAQDKNANWLGATNIQAMQILLNNIDPSYGLSTNEIAKMADEALKSYREIEKKALSYDEIYHRIEKELTVLPLNDFNTNSYAKGMYDAFSIIARYFSDKIF